MYQAPIFYKLSVKIRKVTLYILSLGCEILSQLLSSELVHSAVAGPWIKWIIEYPLLSMLSSPKLSLFPRCSNTHLPPPR